MNKSRKRQSQRMKNRTLKVNRGPLSRRMVQCATEVNRGAINRVTVDGAEFILVESFTLPDNIVMNGGLYPVDEVNRSFHTLERTLAPIEHPTDSAGNFISASDPEAINNFYAGAFNTDVERVGNRVKIVKRINVQEAMKTERGRRLLDRIEEIETNDNARPIHTSVAAFLDVEETSGTNDTGQDYTWVARNMVFDHDAILLKSVGAAQPNQGVGLAVNGKQHDIEVDRFTLNTVKASKNLPLADSDTKWDSGAAVPRVREHTGAVDAPNADYAKAFLWYDSDNADQFGAYKLPFADVIDGELKAIPAALRNAAARLNQTQGPSDAERTTIRNIIDTYLGKLETNAEGLSIEQIYGAVHDALNRNRLPNDDRWVFVHDIYPDDSTVIYEFDNETYQVEYKIDMDGRATVVGLPMPVQRQVTYQPKTNSQTNSQTGDAMKEKLLAALRAAGITVNAEATDDEIMQKYNALMTNTDSTETDNDSQAGDVAAVVANAVKDAVKPLTEEIATLKGQITANQQTEIGNMVKLVVNSGKYPELDEETVKSMPVDALKKMAANCQTSFGLGMPVINSGTRDEAFTVPDKMPQ